MRRLCGVSLVFSLCAFGQDRPSARELAFELSGPVSTLRVEQVKVLRQLALPEHFISDCSARGWARVVHFNHQGLPTFEEQAEGDGRRKQSYAAGWVTGEEVTSPRGTETQTYSGQTRVLDSSTTEHKQMVRRTAPDGTVTDRVENDIIIRRKSPDTMATTNLSGPKPNVSEHTLGPDALWQENVFVDPDGVYRREKLFYRYPRLSWLERAQALDRNGEVLIDVRIRPDKTIESVELLPQCSRKDPDPSCKLSLGGANAKRARWSYSFDPKLGFFGDATQPMKVGDMQVGSKQTYRIYGTEYHFENHYTAIDPHGNWTTEVCSMFDPKTGALVDFEQVDRTIEYEGSPQ